ncbi:MAG: SRPBCC family protein [Silicimonas sp.]|jgi:hypothetical protein|nr:SRPBCC family protein [Silicimonas sp.]
MKFSAREDVEAPLESVFAAVSDFDAFERRMLRRGIDVTRDETVPNNHAGARWQARFKWRGREYDVDAKLVSLTGGEGYVIQSHANGVDCLGTVDLVALSKTRTRMLVSLDLKPTTLSARILMQSMRLAKSNLSRRFKHRIGEFASGITA